ncbi:hypothetical protein [Aequorivita sediminis]|uniref:hypothetical protein n=1 Tax=Aequorivita sediminis TaxID=3073653 RepID=UPI0028A8E1E8|nr:hypothetical protein [Aequorivita sp. F6058]
MIFVSSSAHAEATLVIILVGFNARILDSNIFNGGTFLLILLTCLIASIATESATKMNIRNGDD